MPHEDKDDGTGPTKRRLLHAGEFSRTVGYGKARRVTMLDDALGRAWMSRRISAEEYSALKRYALHWLAGGLQGPMQSVDLDRVLAFNPATMSGLAKTERQADHRAAYHAAHDAIGKRPAYVADQVACYDSTLTSVGIMLGYASEAHGRERAGEILSDAGYRLSTFWKAYDR